MAKIMQIENLRVTIPPFRNSDTALRLYHDETNNIRRLTLSELGLNAPDNKTFVIGGVAFMPGADVKAWAELRALLRVQPNAPEIKFEHIAKGGYENVLGSRKLGLFLQWLLDQNIMIHYSALDPLYWSILDIIESLQVDDRFQINEIHMELKMELHHAVVQNLPGFMELLYGYGYPNLLRTHVRPFIEDVLDFVNEHIPHDRSAATLFLKQTLRDAIRLPDLELTFLHDNKQAELIDDFSHHFMHSIYVFKNASHVFDEETYIEKALEEFELYEGERRLDYRFADSKTEEGIQLSDIVAGLMGRHFSYMQDHSLVELQKSKSEFNEIQLANLEKMRALIERSDAFSEALLHQVMSLETIFKHQSFLFGTEAPPFMYGVYPSMDDW